jgi:hypothetical protein
MKNLNSILDSLHSGLLIALIILWGIGQALAFTFRVSRQWIAEIAGRKEHREDTSHVELVVPVESDVFHLENSSYSSRFSSK